MQKDVKDRVADARQTVDEGGNVVNTTMTSFKRKLEYEFGYRGRHNESVATKQWDERYFTRTLFFVEDQHGAWREKTRAEAYGMWVKQGYSFNQCTLCRGIGSFYGHGQ